MTTAHCHTHDVTYDLDLERDCAMCVTEPVLTTRPRVKVYIWGVRASGEETMIERELPGAPDQPLFTSFVRDCALEFRKEYDR